MQATDVQQGDRPPSWRTEPDILPDAAFHPVFKDLVHRSTSLDVLPVGWRLQAENRYLITVAWPNDHPFYTTVKGNYGANLTAETIRQCGLLLAHAAYDVPLDHHFVMWDMAYTRVWTRPTPTPGPRRIDVETACSDLRYRGRRLAAMTCDMTLRTEQGEILAQGGGRFDIISPAVYRRLRGDQIESTEPPVPREPVPPVAVGRARPMDVLLAPAPGPAPTGAGSQRRWQLRADCAHPTVFDHRNDHFPGMVLVEAALQAANAATAPVRHHWSSVQVAFHSYVEFGPPCWIEVRTVPTDLPHRTELEVTGHQSENPVFRVLLGGTSMHG